MRIVFMGTPDFAVPSLEMLIKEGYEVAAVVTQLDKPKGRGNKMACPPVKECAVKEGIPVNQPEKVKTPEFLAWLSGIKPDLLVTAAYGRILSKEILGVPPLGCINVHASLLPEYRGAAPIQWAVINGEKKTGITTMFTDIGMDTGDILLKKEFAIPEDMTYDELHDELKEIGAHVLSDTLKKLKDGTLVRIPQDNSQATYAPIINKEIGRIDWSRKSKEIHDLVRGTNPWPVSYSFYKGKRVKILKTRIPGKEEILCCTAGQGSATPGSAGPEAGTICCITKNELIVRTGNGYISILEVQFDNCRKMSVSECGHNIDEGEVLG